MTYAEMSAKVSSTELELWFGLALLRQDECPNCGIEPRDLMDYTTETIRCPVCKHEHAKVKKFEASMIGR